MSPKVESLPRQAVPNIDDVIELFLKDQRERLKPRTFSNYESVAKLLQSFLNGYAYQNLSKAEARLFDRHFNAEGDEHREFTQLFGPDKVLEHVDGFLGHFMIGKVMAGADFKRSAGTVTKKLSNWLAANGYVSTEAAEDGSRRSTEAGQDLMVAERAARLLQNAADRRGIDTLTFRMRITRSSTTLRLLGSSPVYSGSRSGRKGSRAPADRSRCRKKRRSFSKKDGT